MIKNRSKNEAVKQCERRIVQNSERSGIGRPKFAATGRVEGPGRGVGGRVNPSQGRVIGRYLLLNHLSPKGWWDSIVMARK